MFEKLQTGKKIHDAPRQPRTCSHPIYTRTLTGVYQAIRIFSPCCFHVFISTGRARQDAIHSRRHESYSTVVKLHLLQKTFCSLKFDSMLLALVNSIWPIVHYRNCFHAGFCSLLSINNQCSKPCEQPDFLE